MWALVIFSLAYSLKGGLKAVALTDAIQVALLIFGGLTVSFIALDKISNNQGFLEGFQILINSVPEKFDMILSKDNPSYSDLPGVWVLIGGLWVAHFAYWGFNQYITQRALGAKSLPEAQKGVMFAAYLKLLMPFVVVLPGICAVILIPQLDTPDTAYPAMMSLLPAGLLGLTFAALIAAIVSSLASMTNSVSTIFTMDIYKQFLTQEVNERKLVVVGRNVALISIVIAALCAQPLLGNLESAFQYIQNFTGFFTPGILVIFLVALFWKKATSLSVLVAALASLILSIGMFFLAPDDFPFQHRMGIVFLVTGFLCYMTALVQGYSDQEKAINLSSINFKTSRGFNISTGVILIVLIAVYTLWW